MHKAVLECTPVYSPRPRIPLPAIPPESWCDFRVDYEAGMSMKAIATKYHCDPRTVRKCLFQNKSSQELGRQTAPTKITPYLQEIDRLFHKYATEMSSMYMLSRRITEELQALGYSGSERTVRNHLRSTFYARTDKEECNYASN